MVQKFYIKHCLTDLLILLSVATCLFFGENIDFFVGYDSPMSLTTILVIGGVLLSFFAIYLIFNLKMNKTKKDYFIFVFLTILFGLSILGIWLFEDHTITSEKGISVVFSQTLEKKAIYTVEAIISYLLMICFLFILPSRKLKKAVYVLPVLIIILFSIASIAYSLVSEFDKYVALFDGRSQSISNFAFVSFFNNKNVFGFVCLIGLFASGVIFFGKTRWYQYFLFLVFMIWIILTSCFTAIISGAFFVLCFFIYRISITYKKHRIRNSLILSFLCIGGIGVAIALGIAYVNKVPAVVNFFNFIERSIGTKDLSTLSGRVKVWSNFLGLLSSPKDWLIGMGTNNFNDTFDLLSLISGGNASHSAESAYVQIIGSTGILGFITYIVFIGYLLYICFYLSKKKKHNIGLISVFLLISILIYSYSENCLLFTTSMKGITLTSLFIPTILSEYNSLSEQAQPAKIVNEERPALKSDISSFIFIVSLISILILGSTLLIDTLRNNYMDLILFIIVALVIALFTLPTIITSIHIKQRKSLLGKYLLYALILFGIPSSLFFVSAHLSQNIRVGMAFAIGSYFFLSLCFALIIGNKHANELPYIKTTFKPLKNIFVPLLMVVPLIVVTPVILNYFLNDKSISLMVVVFVLLFEICLYVMLFRILPSTKKNKEEISNTYQGVNDLLL